MRRGLLWVLGASIALSAAALWSAGAPRLVSAIEPRMREHQESLDRATNPDSLAIATLAPLPAQLPRLDLDPATRDIFAPVQPPAASQPAPPAPVAPPQPPVAAAAPPPPQAPPPNARFLGDMVTPDGKRLVYLMRGDTALAVSSGQQLSDGYVVESITAAAVTLLYPPLDVRVTVPIPPAQPQ